MKRNLGLFVFLLAALVLCGQEFRLGAPVADFELESVDGQMVKLSSLKGDLTVLMFIATKCPVSNAYNDRMNALFADYSGKGVKFVGINSNHSEPAAEVKEHAAQHRFQFAVLKDPGNKIADRFDAQVTPEIFILDKNRVIRYHGYIDDNQKGDNITAQGTRLALDALLAGKSVEKAETKAFGCTIKRVRPS